MSAAIWNKYEHSMADLPNEILCEIFRYVSGLNLIILRCVCTRFNKFINDSPNLTDKIAFKMFPYGRSCFIEGAKILAAGNWNSDCLSIHRIHIKEENLAEFREIRVDWKHLRLHHCSFESAEVMVQFLSMTARTLETLVLNVVFVTRRFAAMSRRRTDPSRSAVLPKMRKLTSTSLPIDFQCTGLTELTLKGPRSVDYFDPIELFENNMIEVLSLTYDHIDFNFKRDTVFRRALVHIKKLVINNSPLGRINDLFISSVNFQRFMVTQINIVEVDIETCFEYKVFALYLKTIFSNMRSVRKLTIRQGYDHIYQDLTQLPQNHTIRELCFERLMDEHAKILFTRIVEACPQIEKLKVFNFAQLILEDAFVHMTCLESIEANVIRLKETAGVHKLIALEKVKFARLEVVNQPEMSYKTLAEQNEFILGRLGGFAM